MRIANKGGAVLAVLALLLAPVGVAYAQLTSEPVEGFAGRHSVDAFPSKPGPISTLSNIIVYDNTTSPALFGFSSTDLAAQFGDELFTTGTGLLSGMVLSLFNSGSSLGPVLTANLGVDLFDGVTSAPLGSFTVNVNFGTGLPPGFFSLITVTNLDPLAINLGVTDVIAIQSAYHGWTAATDEISTALYDNPLSAERRPPWVHPVESPNVYRGAHRGADATERYAADVTRVLAELGASGTGVAGFMVTPAFLPSVRIACSERWRCGPARCRCSGRAA